ncbi:hypothetical protein SBOR_5859 [Sclerotinia borealis F-4128]|uniref:Uncharacterized protein n=1 Tax=Sclerotinia borealis (strain F-4128) TaxID=1432307 RepID=W9CD23_SCLBF|nr:hypothetical protein SBOR_5859 [Sclerotinia borealis F-4128]
MSAFRLGLNCSRRTATSCTLSSTPRVSRVQQRFFAKGKFAIFEKMLQAKISEVIECSDSEEWISRLKLNPSLVHPHLFQKSSPQIIKFNGVSYPPLFLRDSCGCDKCIDTSTKQKNFQTSDIPSEIRAASLLPGENGDINISWENDIPGYGPDHVSTFSQNFFQPPYSSKETHPFKTHAGASRPTAWDAQTIAQKLQYVTYDDYINSEEGLFRALIMLQAYGILILRNVPESETSVVDIAKRIGNLRDTLYGATWDVKSVPQAKNVAYTSQNLGLHMDLLYMANPPGLQLLHCLRNTCSGGSSIFSDGFKAAAQLNEYDFLKLCTHPVGYHYRNAGEHYTKRRTVLTRGPKFGNLHPERSIGSVNYSPPFQAAFLDQFQLMNIAESLRQFASRVEAPENVYEYRLQEGECVIFNNRRVLHGRKEFDTSAGERWLKGAYIDSDVFLSRYRVMAEQYQDRDREFLRTHARYISWDIKNPDTGRMESDPHKVWERSRDLPQTEVYANHI